MAEVKIPFQERWQELMLTGRKVCTSRTRRYGDVGDTFYTFGERFALTKVTQWRLESVACLLCKDEGCVFPEEFRTMWRILHPRAGWRPEQKVWVHYFKRMNDAELR